MFDLSLWHILVLLLVGLFIFGPDRLPVVARDAGRMLARLRRTALGLTEELKAELGPELGELGQLQNLRDLHPRTLVQRHLLDGWDDPGAAGAPPARPGGTSTAPTAPGAAGPPRIDPDTT